MNNIRKIITERLDNARNDFLNALNNGKATDREIGELQYTVATYQDCLNLLPAPRTEQDILNDFEKLGWKISMNDYYGLILKNKRNELLKIYNISKTYHCECSLLMQEHKLLNELFEVIFDE